jgi:hypothetical protein
MSAADTLKEPKPYDPTRRTGRLALAAVVTIGLVEAVTWLTSPARADGLVPILVLILGVVASPILTLVFGSGLVHDARFGDKYPVDDLIGFGALWAVAAALAIYSGMNFTTFSLGILMLSTVALLRVIRTDRRAMQ